MKIRKYTELNALKGRIREKKSSYQALSEKMGMSKNALNDKINGYSVFNTDEVGFLVEELDISDKEIMRYFFPQLLRNVTDGRRRNGRAVGE